MMGVTPGTVGHVRPATDGPATCGGQGHRESSSAGPIVVGRLSVDNRIMIEIDHVTKRYGEKVAVDDLTFSVKPGIVTGFLGPNGAGKSTTMRVILRLDRPTSGTATVNGQPYRALPAPIHEVGALLEARAVHTGRSA